MTNKDIYDLLNNTLVVLDSVSKTKAKQITRILIPAQQKYHCDFRDDADDWATRARNAILNFMNHTNLIELFNKQQIKSLYRILSDYGIYPTCPLCGKPIKEYSNNKLPGEFSWDHITPKSLGGVDDLYNLQPTHKDCNNRKGNDMLYHASYNIEVIVNINFSIDMSKRHARKNLHKKDYWRQTRLGRSRY